MVNYHSQLVSTLKTILPCYYEMTLHSGIKTPCISYMELNNSSVADGDTLGYSRAKYQIKVWGDKISVLQDYAQQIDDALRKLGFKRVSCTELSDNESNMIQKIMTYECLFKEDFK